MKDSISLCLSLPLYLPFSLSLSLTLALLYVLKVKGGFPSFFFLSYIYVHTQTISPSKGEFRSALNESTPKRAKFYQPPPGFYRFHYLLAFLASDMRLALFPRWQLRGWTKKIIHEIIFFCSASNYLLHDARLVVLFKRFELFRINRSLPSGF